MRTAILAILAISIAAVYIQTAHAQKIKAVRDAESASVLKINIARNLPDTELHDLIEKDARGRTMLAENPDKIRQAFVFCVPSGSKEVESCVQRVFVTDLGPDETYEITGEELFIEANRLVTGLKWVNNNTLSYERWASPHYGHRYIVDVKQLKQTGAFILSDQ